MGTAVDFRGNELVHNLISALPQVLLLFICVTRLKMDIMGTAANLAHKHADLSCATKDFTIAYGQRAPWSAIITAVW